MSIFLSGSLAYDYVMNFPDRFQRHLLPDQLHILSVCFGVEKLERGWGGTAGNIAYAMCLLGARPIVASAIGSDGGDYLARLQSLGLNTSHIIRDPECMTASAHIITDMSNNQITAFFGGPLAKAAQVSLHDIQEPISFALMSPNPKEVMDMHLSQAKEKGIKTAFDPGQQITTFSPEELRACVEKASFVIGNDYEIKLLTERTAWSEADLLQRVEVLITTLGEQGSRIQTKEGIEEIKPCPPKACVDPTGAGDAFRAGFFVGYEHGNDLRTCAQMGSVAATYAIETYGTQEYTFTKDEFCERYLKEYGEKVSLSSKENPL